MSPYLKDPQQETLLKSLLEQKKEKLLAIGSDSILEHVSIYTEPQKKHHNFNNSIRYGEQSIYIFLFFKLQVFIAAQGVGTHHK